MKAHLFTTHRVATFPMRGYPVLLAALAASGCHQTAKPTTPAVAPAISPVQFTDITAAAGVHFVHNNGATGSKWLPETMGSGCAFLDYDGDGRPDIFLVNSRDWTPEELRRGHMTQTSRVTRKRVPGLSTCALYHNRGDGSFEDVTPK